MRSYVSAVYSIADDYVYFSLICHYVSYDAFANIFVIFAAMLRRSFSLHA